MSQCYDGKVILGLIYVELALFMKDRLVNNEQLQVQGVKTQNKSKEKTETVEKEMLRSTHILQISSTSSIISDENQTLNTYSQAIILLRGYSPYILSFFSCAKGNKRDL